MKIERRAGARTARAVGTAGAAALLLMLGVTTGCGASSTASGHAAGGGSGSQTTVTVATIPVLSAGDFFVAQSKGFFRQHHLHVNFKPLNGGAAVVPALESGAVQIGESNIVSVLQGVTHGIREPCFTGGAIDAGTTLLAGGKSSVRSVSELAGKTVAVNPLGGANQLVLEQYLSEQHVNPSSVHIIQTPYPDMPAALSSNRVAAELSSTPFSTIAVSQGATVLASNPQRTVTGNANFNCWNANASWLASHKAVAADFAAAIKQAHVWIAAHPTAFRGVAEQHLDISSAVMRRTTLPVFSSQLSRQSIETWESLARQQKLLTAAPPFGQVLVDVGSNA